jgi:hypothetical protein
MNRLLFGDNLKWPSDVKPLRAVCRSTAIFPDASVDLEYPKIQILTVEGLLAGTERLEAPPAANPFAKAEREVKAGKQEEML